PVKDSPRVLLAQHPAHLEVACATAQTVRRTPAMTGHLHERSGHLRSLAKEHSLASFPPAAGDFESPHHENSPGPQLEGKRRKQLTIAVFSKIVNSNEIRE